MSIKKYKVKMLLETSEGAIEREFEIETTNIVKYVEEFGRTRHIKNWEVLEETPLHNQTSNSLLFG